MGFTLPVMPITCNIWHSPTIPPVGVPDVETNCNLAWGKRVNVPSTGGTGALGVPLMTMQLLLPPLTDIRGDPTGVNSDTVECPAGSGRYYRCYFADDLGKGFPNEHRGAILGQDLASWPMPAP